MLPDGITIAIHMNVHVYYKMSGLSVTKIYHPILLYCQSYSLETCQLRLKYYRIGPRAEGVGRTGAMSGEVEG